MKVALVTGGAGFIGSNFIRYFLKRNKNFIVVNLDKLTYAGNLDSLKDLEDSPRYHFIKGDICNFELVDYVLRRYRPQFIINFASESHSGRSLKHPLTFAATNIMGTVTLLEGARFIWGKNGFKDKRFIQVSASPVYGSPDNGGLAGSSRNSSDDSHYCLEESLLMPETPYSASKAGADLMAQAFWKSYRLPVIITRGCGTYGPYQNTENFISSCITNALQDRPIPIFGNGSETGEWIHVLDHCTSIIRALFYGKPGEAYNIGAGEEISNILLAKKILAMMGKPDDLIGTSRNMICEISYGLNSYKIKCGLNWSKKYSLDDGLIETIEWYKNNRNWWESGE